MNRVPPMIELHELDREQIYRFLGYQPQCQTITPQIQQLTDQCIREALQAAQPRAAFSPILPLQRLGNQLCAAGVPLLGQEIRLHLKHCTHAVFLAVTLGTQMDRQIRTAQVTDMARAVLLDAAANTAVEAAAQQAEDTFRDQLHLSEHRYLTGRYSPGYGDFPLAFQRDLLRLTDASRRIGLSVTPSHLLTPRKSITAVLGIADLPVTGHLAGCSHCVLRETCLYRKKGITCAVFDP